MRDRLITGLFWAIAVAAVYLAAFSYAVRRSPL
jgi:hypothetical protein